MELAIEIVKREIAQRELALQHKLLNRITVEQELYELNLMLAKVSQFEPPVKPEIADSIEKINSELTKIQLRLLTLLSPEHHENTCGNIHKVREYLINIE